MSTKHDMAQLVQNAVGIMGFYQLWIIFWIYLHTFPVVWHQFMVLLVAPPAEFTCSNPSLDKCDKNCPSYVYDHSVWEETIVQKWNFVCGRAALSSTIQSIIMLGILFGNISFGILADKFGRKIPLVTAVILQLVFGVAAAFSPDMYTYTFLRFVSTIATGGTMMPSFAIIMEFTAAKYRTLIAVLSSLPVNISHAVMGPIGYFFRRWDHLQLIFSLFSVLLLLYWCVLPESPRWLITMGRTDDAIKVLERAASCNKRPTENIRSEVEQYVSEAPKTSVNKGGKVADLFMTSRMRCKTIVQFFVWFITSLLFYAVAQYIGQIDGGNIFVNITFAGTIQIPGCFLCCILISRLGRKWTLIVSCLIISVSMLIMIFLPTFPAWPNSLCSCLGMMGASMSFSLIYVYSAELFPTTLRTTGLGCSSMFARFGSMTAPFIMHLKEFASWLPPLIFAVLPALTIITILLFLPETNGKPLPDTVEEADQI